MLKNRSYKNTENIRYGKYNKPISSNYANNIYCLNCGKSNHIASICTDPINSYGLLCFYRTDDEVKLIMIRRRHTIQFTEFLRGRYDVKNFKYILELFCKMTSTELSKIFDTVNFDMLRKDLGLANKHLRIYKAEYETSELKFNYLLKLGILSRICLCINNIFGSNYSIKVDDNCSIVDLTIDELQHIIDVKEIIGDRTIIYDSPEWGIPKGKRELRETDLQCSIREFCEETGLVPSDITIYKNVVPLEELYIGMNGQRYRHVYFLSEINDTIDPVKLDKLLAGYDIQETDIQQRLEISKIKLMYNKEAVDVLRSYHVPKMSVIEKAFYNIQQMYRFFN